jgi:6-phosphogluconolactonase
MTFPSNSPTPFGFAVGNRGQIIVSEAVGGMANAGVLSSYFVSRTGMAHTISGSVADNQTAPCWVVLSGNGRFAYTTNTGSGSVSSYAIGFDGTLTLMKAVAANTGAGSSPLDAATSNDKRFLYFLTPGTTNIQGFALGTDGSLSPVNAISSIPASAAGLAAR